MTFTIYRATCPEGRSYIGCTTKGVEHRWRQHQPCPRQWPGAEEACIGDGIARFGKAAFTVEVLATTETVENAKILETALIAHFETVGAKGYNRARLSNLPLNPYTGPHWSAMPRRAPEPLTEEQIADVMARARIIADQFHAKAA